MKRLLALMVGSALFFSCNDKAAESETAETKPGSETASAPKDAEIGDPKYTEMAKSTVANLSTGDIDSYMTGSGKIYLKSKELNKEKETD